MPLVLLHLAAEAKTKKPTFQDLIKNTGKICDIVHIITKAVILILATTALMLGFYTNAVFTRFLVPVLLLIVGYVFEMRTRDGEDSHTYTLR